MRSSVPIHAFFKQEPDISSGKPVPFDMLEFHHIQGINHKCMVREASQIPSTNKPSSADSEFYAELCAPSLAARRPQRHQGSYIILPKSKCNHAGSASQGGSRLSQGTTSHRPGRQDYAPWSPGKSFEPV